MGSVYLMFDNNVQNIQLIRYYFDMNWYVHGLSWFGAVMGFWHVMVRHDLFISDTCCKQTSSERVSLFRICSLLKLEVGTLAYIVCIYMLK